MFIHTMEEIRDEDRGTETMVFEITSIQLNATLQFCVGNAYEHNGKNRYNVYLVKQNRVMKCIGHYDIDMDENPKDEGGKDFNVLKYQEPTWLITSSSSVLSRDIRVPDAPEPEPEPEPVAPSMFKVIPTENIFELITILIDGKLTVDVNEGLINAITRHIAEDNGKELIAKYRECVKYNDKSTSQWKFIHHLFNDLPTLSDKDVIQRFEDNFKTSSYVDEFILFQIADFLQRRHNMYFLLLKKNGRVEDYTVSDAQQHLERKIIPRPDNLFVVTEFDTQKSTIKLIIQETPLIVSYTLDTLPDVMKQKFPLFQHDEFRGPDRPEPPEPIPDSESDSGEEEILDTGFANSPKKPELVRQLTPPVEEPIRPRTPEPVVEEPVRPRTPSPEPIRPPAPAEPRARAPSPEPIRPPAPAAEPPAYTMAILKKKTIEELKTIIEEEINASAPVAKIQRVSKKDGLIKYILNPTEETLQEVTGTRRNRPTGGRFTRRR